MRIQYTTDSIARATVITAVLLTTYWLGYSVARSITPVEVTVVVKQPMQQQPAITEGQDVNTLIDAGFTVRDGTGVLVWGFGRPDQPQRPPHYPNE